MLSLPSGVSRVVYSSLELMQPQTQLPSMPPSLGIDQALGNVEVRDEEPFTFWIVPPRRTTMAHGAIRGHVGVCGLCCCPRP